MLKYIILITLFLSTLFSAPTLKTGQTQSYDENGSIIIDGNVKDDGYYQKGVDRKYDFLNLYGKGKRWVRDYGTGLVWQTQLYGSNNLNLNAARSICGGLWRLPTMQELRSITDYGAFDMAANEVFNLLNSSNYYLSNTYVQDFLSDGYMTLSVRNGMITSVSNSFINQYGLYATMCVQDTSVENPSKMLHTDTIVQDDTTRLMWQDNDQVKSEKFSWREAINYCEALTLKGFENWRLPNINELFSIVDYDHYIPRQVLHVTNEAFKSYPTDSMMFWSSTSYYDNPSKSWLIRFTNGAAIYDTKSKLNRVRCVRDAETSPETLYKSNTDLTWQNQAYSNEEKNSYYMNNGSESGKVLQWENAVSYCQNLELSGADDWRLPNINELLSIVNLDSSYTMDGEFTDVTMGRFWSSTTAAHATNLAQQINFVSGNLNDYNKTSSLFVRCVRSGEIQKTENTEHIVKTGQKSTYIPGDDGSYQKGLERSYSRDNGVVSDNATQLQWQDDYGNDAQNYNVYNTDYDTAQTYCASLDLNGKTDWRLPSRDELLTLVDWSQTSDSTQTNDPATLNQVFVNRYSVDSSYLSSTLYKGNFNDESDWGELGLDGYWAVDLNNGNSLEMLKTITFFGQTTNKTSNVRCVREAKQKSSLTPLILYLLN